MNLTREQVSAFQQAIESECGLAVSDDNAEVILHNAAAVLADDVGSAIPYDRTDPMPSHAELAALVDRLRAAEWPRAYDPQLAADAIRAAWVVAAQRARIEQMEQERDCDEGRVADLMVDLDRVGKQKDALRAVLADIAARKRYDPNRHENERANRLPRSVTVNLPAELVERMEAVLAQTEIEP